MSELLVQFSSSTAFASMLIRRLTHSRWSHVDFVVPGEGLLGVSGEGDYASTATGIKHHDAGGVIMRPFDAWPYLEPPKIAHVLATEIIVRAIIEAARSQIGKPFDDGALWGFLGDQAHEAPRNWRDPAKWFCSEWGAWSMETGKLFPWPLVVTANRVTPKDLLLLINPFMADDNIADFLPPREPDPLPLKQKRL